MSLITRIHHNVAASDWQEFSEQKVMAVRGRIVSVCPTLLTPLADGRLRADEFMVVVEVPTL